MHRSIGYFQQYSKSLLRCNGGHRRRFRIHTCCSATGHKHQQFSAEQYEPVTAPFVPVRVIAGPGSGKTRVLVGRILHILEENVHDAENILAVSFTNKAAAEMKRRVSERISESLVSKIFFGTFHSFCYRMLKLYGDSRDWVVIDQDGCLRLMENLVHGQLPSLDRKEVQTTSRRLLSQIKRMKNNIGVIEPERVDADADTMALMCAYDDALREQQAVDFDDLLGMCLSMMEKDESIRSKLQKKFKHVLVDEFQDVNKVQYRLLQMLCPDPDPHLFVVGDVDQAIYSWRGANVDLMQSDFQRDYSNSLTFRMNDNYRTRRTILDGAQELINLVQNTERGMFNAVRDGGEEDIAVHKYRDPIQESDGIAEDIRLRLANNPGEQLAILLRTHSQVRCIESALISSKVPYTIIGGISFWKRAEIMDVLAYLRIALNSFDQIAFDRVINTPKRGLGPSALAKIRTFADTLNSTPVAVVLTSREEDFHSLQRHAGLSSKVSLSLQEFRNIVFKIRERVATMPLDETISYILDSTSYREYIESGKDASKNLDKIENIHQLLEQARVFRDALPQGEQDEISKHFIDHVAMNSEDASESNVNFQNPVIVSTMHAAKGLEFDKVYVPGMNDGIVPLSPHKDKIVDAWAHMEEETRLLFVAVTRAKDSLVLSYTQEPITYDKKPGRRPQIPRSRFLSCFDKAIYRDFSGNS